MDLVLKAGFARVIRHARGIYSVKARGTKSVIAAWEPMHTFNAQIAKAVAILIAGRPHEFEFRSDRQEAVDFKVDGDVHRGYLSLIYHALPAENVGQLDAVSTFYGFYLPDSLDRCKSSHCSFISFVCAFLILKHAADQDCSSVPGMRILLE